MRNRDGISLISLVVMIIIIVIFASIATISSISDIKETANTKIDVEISELKKAVSDRMVNHERNPEKYPLIGEKVVDPTDYLYYIDRLDNSEITEIASSINEDNIDYYRLVDNVSADKLGVDSLSTEHYFLVDYYTGKVYGTINIKAARASSEY